MDAGPALGLWLAGFCAGILNALAGGGTLLTFPALLASGLPPTVANATSTVALWPGSLAGHLSFRNRLGATGKELRWMLLPSLVGGGLGALLLLATPERRFAELAPWLVLFATLLFASRTRLASGPVAEESISRPKQFGAGLLQLAVGVYGGFFGAGIGILMLALLASLGVANVHRANSIKNLLATGINGVAACIFLGASRVSWPPAVVVLAGAIFGGWVGPPLGLRLGSEGSRRLVVLVGAGVSAYLFLRLLAVGD